MKRFMSFLLALALGMFVLTAEEFTTGGIFVHSATEGLNYNLVGQTTTLTERVHVGQTYRLETDIFEFITKNDTVVLEFSTGLLARVREDSQFSVDAFNQLVVNYEEQPSLLRSQYAITTLSLLNGELEVMAPKVDANSQCVVQTPLANVILTGGKYTIKSNQKYIIVNVIEGSATIMGLDEKTTVIDKGTMGLVIPFPGKSGEIMVTSKGISPEEAKKLTNNLKELEALRGNVVFAVVEKKVVGIRLK